MLDEVGIIHMNGRIYDPKLGRFLQADASIDGVTSTQGYNRYSYVHNNPLNAIDPSGHFSLRKYVGLIVAVIGTYICGPQCGQLGYAIIGASAGAAGAAGAAANGDNILQGAVLGGISGTAFSGVAGADFSGLGAFAGAVKFASFGAVGGVTAVLAGGKFGHGFIAAGAGGTVGGKIDNIGGSGGGAIRTATRTILGGTISKLTGGKFANGAGAAAFASILIERARAEALQEIGGTGTADSGMFTKNEDLIDNVIIHENGNVTIKATVSAEQGQKKARNIFIRRANGTSNVRCESSGCSKQYKLTIDLSAHTGSGEGDLHVVSRGGLSAINYRYELALADPSRCTFACAPPGTKYIHINNLNLQSKHLRHELFHNIGFKHGNRPFGDFMHINGGKLKTSHIEEIHKHYGH